MLYKLVRKREMMIFCYLKWSDRKSVSCWFC